MSKTDRERAISLLEELVGNEYTDGEIESVESAFAEIRKECEAGWVSVNDRIPELGDYSVLTYWGHGGIGMIHVEDYFRDITNGLDADGNQLYTKFYLTDGITHWMPLPAAPEGEL